jgi:mono/diheme cytochrome c family protein
MSRSRRLKLLASPLCAIVVALAACGSEGIQVAESDPAYRGAVLFNAHCAGCHTFSVAGAEGSATQVSSRENKDGPNFDERAETAEDVLYAIENGGFSSGPMPQNIVTGEEARTIAEFVAKYSGRQAERPPDPQGGNPPQTPSGAEPPEDTQ